MRETPLRLGTSIRCSIWCSTANLPQTQLQGGMPEIRLSRNHGVGAALTAYLRETLTAIANGHPASRIDDLMPWAFQKPSS